MISCSFMKHSPAPPRPHLEARLTSRPIHRHAAVGFSMVTALVLLAVGIDERAFWLDEAQIGLFAREGFGTLIDRAVADNQPIFYVLLIKAWSLLAGRSELALRAFSAVCVLLAIPLAHATALRLTRRQAAADIAALATATNHHLLFWGMQARPYTLAPLMGLVSFYLLLRLLAREPPRPRAWLAVAYGLTALAMVYTHPWCVLIFGVQVLGTVWLTATGRTPHRQPLLAQGVVVICSLPLAWVMVEQGRMGVSTWMSTPPWWTPIASITFIMGRRGLWIAYLALLVGAAGVYAAVPRTRRRRPNRPGTLAWLLGWLLLPMIGALVVSHTFRPAYYPGRYDVIVAPAFFLLLGWTGAHVPRRALWLTLAPLLIALSGWGMFHYVELTRRVPRNDRTVAAELVRQVQHGDWIVMTGLTWGPYAYYIPRLNEPTGRQLHLRPFPPEMAEHPGWQKRQTTEHDRHRYRQQAQRLIEQIRNVGGHARVWVLMERTPAARILRQNLDEAFELEAQRAIPPPRPAHMRLAYILRYGAAARTDAQTDHPKPAPNPSRER